MPTLRDSQYPVPEAAEGTVDRRWEQLARDVGHVLEAHGFPRVNGMDRAELEEMLWQFVHVERGDASDLRMRVSHIDRRPEPSTFTAEGALDSDDCCGAAADLRRKKHATGALVFAMDDAGMVHAGMSIQEGTPFDYLSFRMFAVLDTMAARRVKDVVIEMDEANGGVS